jgi:hypothetical protein
MASIYGANIDGAKMEQKRSTTTTPATDRARPSVSTLPDDSPVGALSNPDEIDEVRKLLKVLDDTCGELPADVQRSLRGPRGMLRLYVAMTELLESYCNLGCGSPEVTCEQIAEVAPDLYQEFGRDRILALGEELLPAEFPEQSEKLQEMFQAFNVKYFSGRLPEYRILVVFDVPYWQMGRLGYPVSEPHAITGFIDSSGRIILVGVRAGLLRGATIQGTLLHEMAHAATDDEHGDLFKAEIARLILLGAPVNECDLEDDSPAAEK